MLRIGRHFRLSDDCWVVVGRNEVENDQLEKMAEPEDFKFIAHNDKSPLVLVRGKVDDDLVPLISQILVRYSTVPEDSLVPVSYQKISGGEERSFSAKAMEDSRLEELRIKHFEK